MDFKAAINKAKEAVSGKDGYILSSALTRVAIGEPIDHWQVSFNNSDKHLAFIVTVSDSGVKVTEESEPLVKAEYAELTTEGKLSSDSIYDRALQELKAKGKKVPELLFVVRDNRWDVIVITQNIKIIRIGLDATTGELLHFSEEELLKNDV